MVPENQVLKDELRAAAERCIEQANPDWWSTDITGTDAFIAAEHWADLTDADYAAGDDAATFLLLVAEAI